MLAARITLRHFSVSSTISFSKSAGEPASGMPPNSANRALTLGSAKPALMWRLRMLMIPLGVFFGTQMPFQPLAS